MWRLWKPWASVTILLLLASSSTGCYRTHGSVRPQEPPCAIPEVPEWRPVETVDCEHAACLTDEGARTYATNILALTSWAREVVLSCNPP